MDRVLGCGPNDDSSILSGGTQEKEDWPNGKAIVSKTISRKG